MDSEERREYIMQVLRKSDKAVTGMALARDCRVSRQIIVGDVAILRAQGMNIIATPRGYKLLSEMRHDVRRVFVVCHGWEQMEAELLAMVDNGGIVRNVGIEHEVYGNLEADMNLGSRRDVLQYMEHMKQSHAELLSRISGGIHTHLVEASREEDLDAIQKALQKLGVLYT